jgi:hypothetical protein
MIYLAVLMFIVIVFSCEPADNHPCDKDSPNRIGAICNDGTRSNSVGSGTCSGHGGVKSWLCN